MLTAERARELLSYDPETGVLIWKERPSARTFAGDVAGSDSPTGYRDVKIQRKSYRAHRVAWLITHGAWPSHQLDHINGDRSDNRLVNLREATHAQNMQNKRLARADSKTGVKGITPRNRGFEVKIHMNGRGWYLGVWPTMEDAHNVYLSFKRLMHPYNTL